MAYDPFDLATVPVWYQGQRVQIAQPLMLKARVSPKVRKSQAPPPEPTGISYLDLIRQAHEERLVREAQGLQFRAMNPARGLGVVTGEAGWEVYHGARLGAHPGSGPPPGYITGCTQLAQAL